ncbi:MAG TPA: ABC transporter permease subunit [Jatrophihabitans sp.]
MTRTTTTETAATTRTAATAATARTAATVLTIAALTLREAARRRVLLALAVLTVVLLALSGWGFSRLAAESGGSALTSGEARLTASILLNLVMFGFSLIAALGTAFLAGPTLAGETESGIALAVLARPIRRSAFLLGKWLGLVAFGSGFVVLAGLAQCLVVRATVDYWPPQPAVALALLAAQTIVLLTLAVLLSTAISPMASGVVAVGLFGTTWVAGVVGGVGASLGNDSVERVGDVSRMLLPTDGLWRGAMHAFQDPSALFQFGGEGGEAFPFLSVAPPTAAYLVWAAVWVAMVWGLAAASFLRKDL